MSSKKYCLVCNVDLIGKNYRSIYDNHEQEETPHKKKDVQSKKAGPYSMLPAISDEIAKGTKRSGENELAAEQFVERSVGVGTGRPDVVLIQGEPYQLPGQLQDPLEQHHALQSQQPSISSHQTSLLSQSMALPGPPAPLPSLSSQLPNQQGHLSAQHEALPSQQEALPSHQTQLPNQQEPLHHQQQPLSRQHEALPSQQGQLPNQQQPLLHQQQSLSRQQEALPSQQDHLQSQQGQLPSQQGQLQSQQDQLQSQQDQLQSQQGQLQSQQGQLQSQQVQLPSQQVQLPSQQGQLQSQQETLSIHQAQTSFQQGLVSHPPAQYTGQNVGHLNQQGLPQDLYQTVQEAPPSPHVRQPSHEEVQMSQRILQHSMQQQGMQQNETHQPHQDIPTSHQIDIQAAQQNAQTGFQDVQPAHQSVQSGRQDVPSPHQIGAQPSLQVTHSGHHVSQSSLQGLQTAQQHVQHTHQVAQEVHQDVPMTQPVTQPTSVQSNHQQALTTETVHSQHAALLDQQAASSAYQTSMASHPVSVPDYQTLPPAYHQSNLAHTTSTSHAQLVYSHTDVVSSISLPALTQSSLVMNSNVSVPSSVSQLQVPACTSQQVSTTAPALPTSSIEHTASLSQSFTSMPITSVAQSMVDSYMNVNALGQSSDRSYMQTVSTSSNLHPQGNISYGVFSDANTWNQTIPVSASLPIERVPTGFDMQTSQANVALLAASASQMAFSEGQQGMEKYAGAHLPPQQAQPMDTTAAPSPQKPAESPFSEVSAERQAQPPMLEAKNEGVKAEKEEEESDTKSKKEEVKLEKDKAHQDEKQPSKALEKTAEGELKERLESALQLSLSGKVCHSKYVCEDCENKLNEVELYYKVVAEFRQSFFETAQQHGVDDQDIAEGISMSSAQSNQKSFLEKFLQQASGKGGSVGGADVDSTWQQLINPRFLESAISESTSWVKTVKQKEHKVQEKKEEEAPMEPPQKRKRGRPRKSALPMKSPPVKKALPTPARMRPPPRKAKVKQEAPEVKRRGRKPRQVVNPEPVPVDDNEEEEDTIEDVYDEDTDDEWKPANEKQPAPDAKPVSVKEETKMEKAVPEEEEEEKETEDEKGDDPDTAQDLGEMSSLRRLRKRMYMCVVCNKSFSGVTVLKFHIAKKHKGRKLDLPYRCVTCSESFQTPTKLRLHVKVHAQDENRNCEVCGKAYGSVAALNLHIRNKHPHMRKRTGKFTCTTCSKRFSCIQSLQMHTRTQHDKEREIHTCSVCSRNFLDKERKLNHEAKCENDMEKLNLVRNLKSERSYVCKICDASYKNKSAFKQHHYTHKDEKPHQCRLCESKFLYKKSLTDHVAAVHHGERRMKAFKCEVCGHGYSHAGDLAKHMTLHSGKFCCPTCNKACAGSYKLKEHMRIHTGEKPYKCEECGAAFTQAAGLKSHQYTHKANKRFLCTICGMQFAHRTTFRRHGMTHTGERPYKCTICNKGFQFDWVLKDHIKTHTGEKPHLCAICGKSFTQPQHLKTHYRIHTGEKPYRCVHCDVSYRHLSSYNQHKRNCPVTGTNADKKERPKVRKIIPPGMPPSTLPPVTTQMSTLLTADMLAHQSRPTSYLQPDEGLGVLTTDQSHMRLPSHHSLIGPPPPSLSGHHLTRVTLPETSTTTMGAVQQGVGGHPMHQAASSGAGRHLLQLGSLTAQDLTPMQHAVIPTSVSVGGGGTGLQPMDMTSSSAMAIAGQGQHDQTVQAFSTMMPAGYNQNYIH